MSAHTPGPWHVEARRGETCICRKDGAILARLGAATNWRANARLLAAAPDLLEALRALLAVAPYHAPGAAQGVIGAEERHASAIKAARAAIAKAEGNE